MNPKLKNKKEIINLAISWVLLLLENSSQREIMIRGI